MAAWKAAPPRKQPVAPYLHLFLRGLIAVVANRVPSEDVEGRQDRSSRGSPTGHHSQSKRRVARRHSPRSMGAPASADRAGNWWL